MDCISSCISCNELTLDKHVYWFKSAAHWIAYLYNSLVNQKHIVAIYVSSREVAATDNSYAFGHPWMFYPAALWAATLSFYFFQIKLSNPKFKNIIKFSSAAKKFEETYETKVSSTQKIKMQNAMMKKKLLKYLSFHVQNNLK